MLERLVGVGAVGSGHRWQVVDRRGQHFLLARAKMGSANAIDAFVVATAIELSPAMIATGDRDDLARLAKDVSSVRIFAI